jgi:hypothetical protein
MAWEPMNTAPKTEAATLIARPFLAVCIDPDLPEEPRAIRVVWWEPLMNEGRGQWYGDRDLKEHPILWQPIPDGPKFENVSCSHCGNEFGPGDHGFSHCEHHAGLRRTA